MKPNFTMLRCAECAIEGIDKTEEKEDGEDKKPDEVYMYEGTSYCYAHITLRNRFMSQEQ